MSGLSDDDRSEILERNLRVLEALLFAASEPLDANSLLAFVSDSADIGALLLTLQARYAGRGVNLVQRGDKWAFRTAEDLGFLLRRDEHDSRPLSRAALDQVYPPAGIARLEGQQQCTNVSAIANKC